jgi:hypothetical protein
MLSAPGSRHRGAGRAGDTPWPRDGFRARGWPAAARADPDGSMPGACPPGLAAAVANGGVGGMGALTSDPDAIVACARLFCRSSGARGVRSFRPAGSCRCRGCPGAGFRRVDRGPACRAPARRLLDRGPVSAPGGGGDEAPRHRRVRLRHDAGSRRAKPRPPVPTPSSPRASRWAAIAAASPRRRSCPALVGRGAGALP